MSEPLNTSELRVGDPTDELISLVALMEAKYKPLEQLAAFAEAVSPVRLARSAPTITPEHWSSAVARVTGWKLRGLDVRPVSASEYPSVLRSIFNKPPLVFIQGTWDDRRDAFAVAVVGTRKPSSEGIRRARKVAHELARAEITVVSGLAAGIDTAAHTAALDAGGRTVAVIGTGIDIVYPKSNAALAGRITSNGGSIVSQFYPEQPPTQWSFPMRNITMSGLSLATVVIEAGETSGTRQQARHALQHGRTVFLLRSVVEGNDWARTFVTEGYEGSKAIEITSVEEILDRVFARTEVPALAV